MASTTPAEPHFAPRRRPPKRRHLLGFRADDAELELVHRFAQAQGLSVSDYLRAAVERAVADDQRNGG